MASHSNTTHLKDCIPTPSPSSCPFAPDDYLALNAYLIIPVLGTVLALSLVLNFVCCLSKICSGRGRCPCRKRRSRCSRQMEENPIYGNLGYTDASVGVYSEAVPLHPSLSSLSLRNPQRVSPVPQTKNQECYANLTLKAPRPQSGRISPQIQILEETLSEKAEEPEEAETEDPVSIDDAVSTVSDLYASVQTQRPKLVDTADGDEGYANHL